MKQEWIPTSERLPKENEYVLTWTPDCGVGLQSYFMCGPAEARYRCWHWDDSLDCCEEPTHWMPLPQGPEE